MKISNINPIKYNYQNFNKKNKSFTSSPALIKPNVYLTGEYYRSLFNIKSNNNTNISFGNLYHKTISSKKPVYTPCCTTYSNVNKFSKQFANKINSQIQNPSLKDVERLLNNVQIKTGADEKLVKEVVFRLSQFSSFNCLEYIDQILKSKDEKVVEFPFQNSLSASMSYLGKKFNFFKDNIYLHLKSNLTPVSFIDDFILQASEPIANSKFSVKDFFVRERYPNQSQFDLYFGKKSYILDGFDVLTSEGKYCGANFMSGTGYLEALSIDVIKQIQKGKDIEDIMHGDLEKRFRKQLPEEQFYKERNHPVEIIKKPMPDVIEAEDILENLLEPELDAKAIQKTIEASVKLCMKISVLSDIFKVNFDNTFGKYMLDDTLFNINFNPLKKVWTITFNGKTFDLNERNIKTALMKYMDVCATAFSAHSMSDSLNKLGEEMYAMEQMSGVQNRYIIPGITKSYSLLGYMYMKNNELDYSRIFESGKEEYNEQDNFIIVDDSTLSGDSQYSVMRRFLLLAPKSQIRNRNIYFVPIVASENAIEFMRSYGFYNTYANLVVKDIPSPEKLIQDIKSNKKLTDHVEGSPLTYKDISILQIILEKNYKDCTTAIAFPYILPDNNSAFASEILSSLLIKATSQSRKS